MSLLRDLLPLAAYLFLLVPAVIVVAGAWLVRAEDLDPPDRKRLLALLFTALLALALLVLLIWTNPYGRSISSSIPALGLMPVLVALLVLAARKAVDIARLWSMDKVTLAAGGLVSLILFGLLWLAEPITFYTVMILAAISALAWIIGEGSGQSLLVALSLICAGILILTGGGAFFTLGLEDPAWLRTAVQTGSGIATLLAMFLGAAALFGGLRGEAALSWGRLGWRLALAAILMISSAYVVFWDGIWSAAHARAFEDHLPFAHVLFSLIAGVLLVLSLRGQRRLAGPVYVVLMGVVTTLALIWGWQVSAFELTERRAAQVNQAITQFQQDKGRYPASLAELTPRYLLYLPPPVVTHQGGWCYQGGEDYYRLGYVSGDFTYFTADFWVKIHAQSGEPPQENWNCELLLARFETGELVY